MGRPQWQTVTDPAPSSGLDGARPRCTKRATGIPRDRSLRPLGRQSVLMPADRVNQRLRRAFALTLTLAVGASGATACSSSPGTHAADYCAIMQDSIGLYVDNPVTQMGYPIGRIKKITPSVGDVRVDFSLDEQRR